jgi:hypothetical protein
MPTLPDDRIPERPPRKREQIFQSIIRVRSKQKRPENIRGSSGGKKMPFSKPIAFRRLLNAPIDEPNLLPPRQLGVYVVTQHDWPGVEDPPAGDVVYVGRTTALLYRIIVLITDAIGFTGEGKGSGNSYYHSGGHNIWEERNRKLGGLDPRTLYVSWKSDCCEACEEIRLHEKHKNDQSFVAVGTPPRCTISGHPL